MRNAHGIDIHSFRVQWALHLLGLLMLAIVIGGSLFFEYQRIAQREKTNLLHQTTVIEKVLNKKFDAIDVVLRRLGKSLEQTKDSGDLNYALQLLAEALNGVSALSISDAQGIILASSDPAQIGRNCCDTAYFKEINKTRQAALLYIKTSPTPNGTVMVISRLRQGAHGAFAGIVSVSLTPNFFLPLLRAIRYAPDMEVSLFSAEGAPFVSLAPSPGQPKRQQNLPADLLLRHTQNGQASSFSLEKTYGPCPRRIMALRTILFSHFKTNTTLLVGNCRDQDNVYAQWRTDAALLAVMLAALAFFSSLVLVLFQKWQRESERKAAEAAATLAEREGFIRMVTANVPTQIAYWDKALHCLYANNAYRQWFGKTAEEMENISVRTLLGEDAFARSKPFMDAVLAGEAQLFERMVIRPDGSTGYNQVRYVPNRLDGEIHGMFVLAVDVTELKETQAELEKRVEELHALATTDPLTGIANRRFFLAKATEELTRSRRYGQPLAMLMIDVDHFKNVNDTYGHDVGDELLKSLAATLTATMRATDIVARLGGEEFGALLIQTDKETAQNAAERLREALSKSCIQADAEEVCFTVSIGMAANTGGALGSVDDLLKLADLALYHAKKNGRDQVCCHGEF